MCVCLWVGERGFQMITWDWVWLITCLQGTEVCVHVWVSVYRHASAGLSIHVNTSKNARGEGT